MCVCVCGGGGVADEKGFSERASDSTPKSLNPPMLIDLFAFYKTTDSVFFEECEQRR